MTKTKTAAATAPPTEAQKLTGRLVKLGMKYEEIAFKLRVSLNSVIRWRRGVTPHPGHLMALKDLVGIEVKKHKKPAA